MPASAVPLQYKRALRQSVKKVRIGIQSVSLSRYVRSTHSRALHRIDEEEIHVMKNPHKLQGSRHRAQLDANRTDARKTHTKNFVNLSHDNHPEIQLAFQRAKTGKHIARILEQNEHVLTDCSLYNKAMSICDSRRDPLSARNIMDMLLSSKHVSPDLISFTIIVNIMARYEFRKLALKYFTTMIREHSIQPDLIIFGALFKLFKRQCEWQKAVKMLDLMRNTFGLSPNEYVYAELLTIAAKAHQQQEGEALFREYLDKVERGELTASKAVFGAYLHIFSACGDIEGMQRARALNHEYGFALDEVMVGKLMTGYIAARVPEKCHEIFTEWVERHRGSVNHILLGMRCVALELQIEKADTFERRYELFQELESAVFYESEEYGLEAGNPVLINTLLQGTIYLYGGESPSEVIPRFEYLVNEKCIKYSKYDVQLGRRVLDLHGQFGFVPVLVRFIIRYVFAFELEKYVQSEGDELVIIVGKGLHSEGHANKKGKLREFVQRELSSWNPAVSCKVDAQKAGRIVVEYEQLKKYLEDDNNFAKQKLMIPSDDWYKRD